MHSDMIYSEILGVSPRSSTTTLASPVTLRQ